MSSANTRFVAAYTLLVGLPLLGLAGVLKTGRRIAAPVSVNGRWRLHIDNDAPSSQSCFKAFATERHEMLIAQSGKELTLSFADSKVVGRGKINGRDLGGEVGKSAAADQSSCRAPVLHISATLDRNRPTNMIGTITANECTTCLPLTFQADLQAETPQREIR
jgi:hypothetical protein